MPKKSSKGSNASKDATASAEGSDPTIDMARNVFAPIMSANVSLLRWNAESCETLAQGYKQWLKFVGQRLEADASFTEQLQKAKDPQEMAGVCSVFVEKASKDYQREFSELTKLSSALSNGAVDVLQDMSVGPDVGAAAGE